MKRNLVILIAALLLALLFFLCVRHAGPEIEADLTERANAALAVAGVDGVDVTLSGRNALLSGSVGETGTRELAGATIAGVRGVRTVENEIEVGTVSELDAPSNEDPARRGQEVALTWSNDRLTLTGGVSSEASRSAIVTVVSSVFGAARVNDELRITTGTGELAPSEAGAMATLLVHLVEGDARFVDGEVSVRGRAASGAVRDEVVAAIEAHYPSAAVEITTGGRPVSTLEPAVEPTPEPAVELSAEPVSEPTAEPAVEPTVEPVEPFVRSSPSAETDELDASGCGRELDRLLAGERIRFAKNSAEIDPASFGLLERLTAVARRCPGTRLEISGHTDSYGPAEWNTQLSQLRADAVAGYLIRGGIEARRLRPRGYGSARPLADNGTQAGREANRRIEFDVLGNR